MEPDAHTERRPAHVPWWLGLGLFLAIAIFLLGFEGDPHLNPIHIASDLLIVGGFILLSASWRVLLKAQQTATLAATGPYARIRHPQYAAFIVIMVGFLLQWPTILTLAMFPVLVTMYVRLAHREEREVAARFGAAWDAYAAVTPRWVPRLLPDGGAGASNTHHILPRAG
ncbi:MAG: isoprenylcysteine carboxylmethyltransferase family protein [Acidobacteria bacterium]|nr:isoprenylcysteine carboxylmethyltransferase family protein [Acidobacteriota bacterium]